MTVISQQSANITWKSTESRPTKAQGTLANIVISEPKYALNYINIIETSILSWHTIVIAATSVQQHLMLWRNTKQVCMRDVFWIATSATLPQPGWGTWVITKKSVNAVISYDCKECEYKTINKESAKKHRESAHEGVTYDCDQCDHKAKSKEYAKLHKASVHEYIVHFCDLCDYSAKWKSNLDIHIKRVHKKEFKSYQCDICEYSAKYPLLLRAHKEKEHEDNIWL